MNRRNLLIGIATVLTCPVICRAENLMKIRGVIAAPTLAIPSWCPDGWVPANGATVNKWQFPELWKQMKRMRMNGASDASPNFKLNGDSRVFLEQMQNAFNKATSDWQAEYDSADKINDEATIKQIHGSPDQVGMSSWTHQHCGYDPHRQITAVDIIAAIPMRIANGATFKPGIQTRIPVEDSVLLAA